ncbi:MAG: 3D domain-containing protein [Candidatus Scalindua sp.]
MKISKRNVFTRIRKAVLSFIVVLIISLLSMTIVNSLHAEVFTATAYCSCKKCCNKDPSSKWYGITASGRKARWGTVAVDRRLIALGSRLRIQGFPKTIFRADDVGGAIKGKHIDVWFPSHRKALEFGRQKLVVELVSSG